MTQHTEAERRPPLSRDRVLRAAVALADEAGLESLSMRGLAQQLGVVPMAAYKHVANKEELLDGMVDVAARLRRRRRSRKWPRGTRTSSRSSWPPPAATWAG